MSLNTIFIIAYKLDFQMEKAQTELDAILGEYKQDTYEAFGEILLQVVNYVDAKCETLNLQEKCEMAYLLSKKTRERII